MDLKVDVKNGESYEVSVSGDTLFAEVLEKINLNPEGAVAIVDGRPVPEDETVSALLENGDEIQVMKTVSGG
ncbi:MAG: MoaD/ThiS family protein [Halobacteria archaeon]